MGACSIITSVPAVELHLFNNGVINKHLEIVDRLKFNKIANELNEDAIRNYQIYDDIIYEDTKTKRAVVNETAIDSIIDRRFNSPNEVVPNIRYNSTEDKIAWRRAMDRIQTLIPGVNIRIMTSEAIIDKYGKNADEHGFLDNNNNIILNASKFSLDTPFHEYAHLVMRFLKETDIDTYTDIVNKALDHPDRDDFRSKYPDLSDMDLGEEIFVTAVGLKSTETFLKDKSITEKIKGFFKEMVYKALGKKPKNISLDQSLESFIEKWSYDLLSGQGIFSDLSPVQAQELLLKTSRKYSDEDMEHYLKVDGYIIKVASHEVYLDKNGNRSYVYYDAIKKGMSKENAKRKYLRYMNGVVGLKFKRLDRKGKKELEDRIKILDENDKNTVLDPDDVNSYIDKRDPMKRFKRSTSYVQQFKDPFVAEDSALQVIEHNFREEYKIMHPDEDPGEVLKNAREYAIQKMAEMPESVKRAKIDEIIAVYDFKREVGTFTHVITEDYVNLRQQLIQTKADPNKPNYIEVIDPVSKAKVNVFTTDELIAMEAKRPRVVRNDEGDIIKDDKRDGGKYSPDKNSMISGERHNLLIRLETELKRLEKKYGKLEYRTEVKVRSAKLGYAGSIDLLAIEKETGKVHIIDYKTKEKSKAKYWDKAFQGTKLSGEFNRFDDTAETAAAFQTSMYRLMLEEMGFEVDSARAFLIEGNLPRQTDGRVDVDYEQYKDMEIVEKVLPSMKGAILNEYDSRGIVLDRIAKETKDDIIDTVNKIAGGQDIDFFDPSEDYIDKLYNAKTVVDGKAGFMYGERFVPYRENRSGGMSAGADKTFRKAQIRKLLSGREKMQNIEDNMERLFNNPNYEMRDKALKIELLSILKGISSDTHDIVRLSNDYAFGDNYLGMVIFVNKITGEGRFINITGNKHTNLNFGKGHTSVLGKYIPDSQVSAETLAEDRYTNTNGTTESIKMLRVALVIAKLKKMYPEFSVDYVVSTPPLAQVEYNNSANKPSMYDLHTLLRTAKTVMKFAEKEGDVVGSVKELIKDDRALNGEYYKAPLPSQLLEELERTEFKFSSSSESVIASLESFLNHEERDVSNMVYILNDFVRKNKDMPYELKRTVLRTILHLKGFRTAAIFQDINALEKYLTIPSFTANLYINQIASVARGNKRKARVEYIEYTTEHNKVLTDFIGEQTNPFRVSTPDAMLRIINDGKHPDPKKRYMFKSDAELAGDVEGLKYKRYFQKQLKKALMMTDGHISQIRRDNIAAYVDAGYIPLIGTGFKDKLAAAANAGEAKEVVIEEVQRAGQSSEVREEESWDMENRFMNEVAKDASADGSVRNRKLGIRSDGTLGKQTPYETNLSIILDRVMSESLMVKYGKDTLASGRALAFEMEYQKNKFDYDAKGVTLAIEMIAKVFVKGNTGTSVGEKLVGSMSTLATYAAIAGSLSSMILETVTNAANVAKLFIQEDIMGTLLGKKSKFKARHMVKAMKLMSSDGEKANLLMLHFGMKESDPRRLERFMNITEKGKLFKTDNLFGVQTAVLSMAQMEVMISIMLSEGSYDAYYVTDDGKLRYNIKKDGRFFKADGSQTEEQKMLYKKVTDILEQEGKKNPDGTFQVGYIDEELNSIKDYAVEAFSSMDDDSRNAATANIFGRLTGKFKTWVLPRVARIIGTPVEEQLSSSHWNYIRDADGNLIDVIRQMDPAEGYLYTVGKLLKNSVTTGSIDNWKNLDEFKKDQLSKAGADTIMVMLLLAAFQMVTCDDDTTTEDCWHKNSHVSSIFYKSLVGAPSDIFVPITIYQTMVGGGAGGGGIAPAVAVTQRFIGTLIGAGSELAHGNPDQAALDIFNITAASRHFYDMTETYREYHRI